jgi:hypothetical protein
MELHDEVHNDRNRPWCQLTPEAADEVQAVSTSESSGSMSS